MLNEKYSSSYFIKKYNLNELCIFMEQWVVF